MSNQISRNEDEHLICVGIFSSFFENKTESEIIQMVISELKKMKFFSDSGQIVKVQYNSYKGNYTGDYDLKKIERETDNLVEVIHTMDMALGIKQNLFKYNTVNYSVN